MLLTKEVEIKLNGNNIKHYENLGYKIPREYDNRGRLRVIKEKPLLVNVADIQVQNRFVNVDIQCDCKDCMKIYQRNICGFNWYRKSYNADYCNECIENKRLDVKWKYNIGDVIINDNLNLTIIDRRINNTNQEYKIKCNKCGFDSGKHYNSKTKEYKDEYWIVCSNLNKIKNCPCCQGVKAIVVKGINDISTTDPWMIPYFKNKNDLYKYSSTSGVYVDMVCPECRTDKGLYQICVLKNTGYLPCICRKECSIPNKIAYYVLKKLEDDSKILNYKREYSPCWIGLHSYDNYFIIKDKEFIIEMDGGFHFNDNRMNGQSAEKSKEIDDYKDNMAKKHNINIIRIVAPDGKYHETYVNLLNELIKIVDISTVCEEKIMESVHDNFVKKICDYYNENKDKKTMNNIAKYFNIHIHTLRDYLKFGRQYEWCEYENQNEKHLEDKKKAIEMFLNGIGNKDIARELDLHERTIIKYINQERINGNIEYSIEENKLKEMAKSKGKKVFVYDMNKNLLKIYNSTGETERESLNDFGVIFRSRSVSRVCLGQRSHYKGYVFSYVPLTN